MKLLITLLLVAFALADRPKNPSIITIAPDLILVQCTPSAKALLKYGCTKFEPRQSNCRGKDKYTLTEIGGCTAELNTFIQKSRDPFDPYHGSLHSPSFDEPLTLKWYVDSTEREEL